jgi:predicted porin
MKKTYLAGLLPALLLSGAAHAQNSITLYGLIDEGLDYTSNASGHGTFAMVSGDTYGSRFGLKGTEDLGDGLKAIFRLENGFNTNSGKLGQGGLMFGRQAYVGLSSDQYGTFTMGRQYDPTIDMWSVFTAAGNWEGDLASHPYDNDNADFDYRINNSVKYVSPTFRGLTGEAMYGFSNEAGGFADNRVYSAAVQYQMGAVSAAVAYMKTDNGGLNSTGALASPTSVFTAASQQNIDAGASYKFGDKAILSIAYSDVYLSNPISNEYFGTQPTAGSQKSWRFDNFEVNGQYFFKHDLWLGAEYTYTMAHVATVTGNYVPTWNQISLMLDYDLSARTSVYVQGAYQHANGNTGEAFDYAQIIGSPSASSTGNQMVYRIAMLHRF